MDPAAYAELLDLILAQSVFGVFMMRFDEPITWDAEADREALLDYAWTNLRVVLANEATCRQLGVTREALLGTTPATRWSGGREQWRAHAIKLFDQGRLHHSARVPPDYGGARDFEGDYICTYDAEGRVTGYVGVQQDISEARRVSEELVDSQRRLALALAGGEISVWDHDLVTNTVYFDRAQMAKLGYGTEPLERPAAWWERLIHPADLPKVIDAFRAHAAGHAPLYRVDYRLRTAGGDWAWLQTRGKITEFGADGRPARALGVAIDITEKRQLEDQLLLSERLAAVGRLATGVAHEINNPLASVVLTLELMERELAALEPARAARMRALIDRARYGTERVRAVARDLQSLTRPPATRESTLDPIAILERCLEIAEHQLVRRARVERAFAPIPAVRGDEGRMVQVFVNLLVNAAQAIPEGEAARHVVRVATSTARDGRAVIEVADDGAGIPEDVIGRIFDPFFTTKQLGEGTGLGLAIARGIVVAMGGEIEVDSAPGRGTTFRVLLPATAAAPQPPAPDPAPPARPRALRVLVIDDEPMIGSSLCEALPEHDVTFEPSARAALERLRAGERFDRILCDLMMPELSGMELYDQLGALDPALQGRTIFLTGGAVTESAQAFLARVGNRRLAKPFDLAELAEALAT